MPQFQTFSAIHAIHAGTTLTDYRDHGLRRRRNVTDRCSLSSNPCVWLYTNVDEQTKQLNTRKLTAVVAVFTNLVISNIPNFRTLRLCLFSNSFCRAP